MAALCALKVIVARNRSRDDQEGKDEMRGRIVCATATAVLLAPLVPVTGQAARGGMTILAIVPAADYSSSHTVYVAGERSQCSSGCTELWRSRDGGGTWTRANATGWQPGPLLAVEVGGHPELVSAVTGGYGVSVDGGESFQRHAAPGSPTVSLGHGGNADVLMTGSDGSTDYVLGLPAGTLRQVVGDPALEQLQIEPTPAYGSGAQSAPAAMGWGVDPQTKSAHLDWCDASFVCRAKSSIDSGGQLVFSPNFLSDHAVFLLTPKGLLRSADGGTTFAPTTVMLPQADTLITTVTSLVPTPDFDGAARRGALFAAVVSASKSNTGTLSGGVLLIADGGATWQFLSDSAVLASGVSALALAPDGRLFAGTITMQGSSGGVYCSQDGGATWGGTCSPYGSIRSPHSTPTGPVTAAGVHAPASSGSAVAAGPTAFASAVNEQPLVTTQSPFRSEERRVG